MTLSTRRQDYKSKSRRALAPLVSVVVLITAVVIIGSGAVAWSNYSIQARENLVGPQVLTATDKVQESITLEHFWYNTAKQQLNLVLKNTGNIGVNFTQIQIIGTNSSGTTLQITHTGVAPNGLYTAVVPYFWLGDPLDAFVSTTRGSIFRMHLTTPADGILIFKKISMLNNGNFNFNGSLGNFGINTTGYSPGNILDKHGDLILPATVRDFNFSGQQGGHVDFENCNNGLEYGNVLTTLGPDYEPVYNNATANSCAHGFSAFYQWYHDDPTVNVKTAITLNLTNQTGTHPTVWYYGTGHFYPIDNKLFCKGGMGAGKPSCSGQDSGGTYHNFSFTLETHNTFTYRGGETLTFTGDDSVYVFINKTLAIDLGGVHGNATKTIILDSSYQQPPFNLVVGNSYPFDLFYAERHTHGSDLAITTSIQLQSNGQGSTAAFFVDPGTYTVSELVPPGWILESMQCTNGYSKVNSDTITFTVPKGITTCTFTDSQ